MDLDDDECGRNEDRGENFDDQNENILLEDEFRGRRVQIALSLDQLRPCILLAHTRSQGGSLVAADSTVMLSFSY